MNYLPSKYKTKEECLDISGIKIKLVHVVNIDELYEELIRKGDTHEDVQDERIPYWADLWPSAIALSQYIVNTNSIGKNSQVLEIGCGLSLPGIVAGKFSNRIILTDYIKEPLDFAKHNWKLNNDHTAQFDILDWRKPGNTFKADIVLASDVAYEKRSFKYLIGAFRKLVSPRGFILMSEPNRQYAHEFFISLKDKGFDFTSSSCKVNYRNITSKINIYRITSK
jgi:predicted nicotinamide N-methyase